MARTDPIKGRNDYLISYNAVSAIMWAAVLGWVVLTATFHGTDKVFANAANFTRMVQTMAGLEVAHSLTGLVRAPLFTTLIQVASRFVLVWGIAQHFPDTVASSTAYTTMLLAWSTTEVIRYSYFAVNLKDGKVPAWLLWLRYNTFFVLYPLGIGSECWLIFLSTEPARKMDWRVEWALWAVLAVYVPGSYILFTHMMAQRRKVMRASKTT